MDTSHVDAQKSTRTRIVVVTVALIFITTAITFMYQHTVDRAEHIADIPVLLPTTIHSEQNVPSAADGQDVATPVTFQGKLIALADDNSYIRVAADTIGTISVSVTGAKVLINDELATVTELPPLSQLHITALLLPDTAMYDYEAQDIMLTIPPSSNAELEKKADELVRFRITR